ncbi:Alpha beta hydrolase [Musa troglodytarum]|uniref:Alpha beta hydrolase n=1 Tax=Musa troglodytarum TaxID=320322 RepID=A0A9E7G2I5_9LILI|nr:Alpha beta hydrolase [Musa troglodytarum]
MAITIILKGTNDPRLKLRLLRYLVRDRLPEETRRTPSTSKLSSLEMRGLLFKLVLDPPKRESDRGLTVNWNMAQNLLHSVHKHSWP